MTLLAPDDTRTLIDELLEEQQQLTAVERFALRHERNGFSVGEKVYRDLLPARAPTPGEQYAFSVDLDTCSGCQACVTACHNRNGLDEGETWREVGLLHANTDGEPFLQTVSTACHHCLDPGCLTGCPVLAYDKDSVTGIVRHLDDQCIGCQYCVMKCPYEVPKYSKRLGIVRKCDMCASRLAVGEAPACAQACPTEAIRITLVNRAEIKVRLSNADDAAPDSQGAHLDSNAAVRGPFLPDSPAPLIPLTLIPLTFGSQEAFLPDSPAPQITLPTTRFVSRRGLPEGVLAADHGAPRLDNPHWPLVFMLVLTQTAAGMLVAGVLARACGFGPGIEPLNLIALVVLCAGLAVSVLHLGQPLKAWRTFLGWRTSWLSREIMAFSTLLAVTAMLILSPRFPFLAAWQTTLTCAAAMAGLLGVFTSAMVYVDTRRPFWSPRFAFVNFFGTTLLLGATFTAVVIGWRGRLPAAAQFAALAATVVRTALLVWRRLELRVAWRSSTSPIHFNARVIRELLSWTTPAQTWLFVASTLFGLLAVDAVAHAMRLLPSFGGAGGGLPWWAVLAALTTFCSEAIARYVFFAAGASKRMPGGIAA